MLESCIMNPGGDPEGRRLARQKALRLAEAEQLARVVCILLKRAGLGGPSLEVRITETLLKHLGGEQARQLQISYGRVESRSRFKKLSPQPLLERRPVSQLFLDEGGKSPAEPVAGPTFFALGGIAIDEADMTQYCAAANKLKHDFFGSSDITFHEPDMRTYDGRYGFGGDKAKQAEFDEAMNQLIESTPFVTFGVGIRKSAFEQEFIRTGVDPYLPTDVYAVAISMLLERYLDFLAMRDGTWIGRVTFESQGGKEDAEHQLEFARLLLDGTQWVADGAFRNWLETGLRFATKEGSNPCELADMFSRELYEWIRGDCDVTPKRWDMFCRKAYCRGDGRMGKFGIKVFPDSDIRNRIEEHRVRFGATN